MLRLSVGLEREQPFYFVCNKCNAATRGKLVIWYEPHPGYKLELEEGRVITSETPHNQVVNIHPSFPSIADAGEMCEEGGSPFLMHHKLLGQRFVELNSRLNIFCQAKDKDWLKLRRLLGYYVDRNWKLFEEEGRRILEKKWPDMTSDWRRHDVIHKPGRPGSGIILSFSGSCGARPSVAGEERPHTKARRSQRGLSSFGRRQNLLAQRRGGAEVREPPYLVRNRKK
jgi:hypothetical protein